MSFTRPIKYLPTNLSWDHLLKSVENFSVLTDKKFSTSIKMIGGVDDFTGGERSGVVRLSGAKLSFSNILKKTPEGSLLVYAGKMNQKDRSYEQQYSLLSFLAYPWALKKFKEFSEEMTERASSSACFKNLAESSAEALLFDSSGRFKNIPSLDSILKDRIKFWVKKTKDFLEDPFKNDAGLFFPEAFGSAQFVNQGTGVQLATDFYKLNGSKYFNLSEIDGFNQFFEDVIGSNGKARVRLAGASAVVDFMFYTKFKHLIDVERFELDFIYKWVFGYEPLLFFINCVEDSYDRQVILNMSALPLVEVIRIG